MRNVTLVSGKNVIVNENDLSDIAGIVREECSPELSEMMEEMLSDKLSDLEDERNALVQEMRSYESDLEDAQRSLHDIWDDAEELLTYIAESKRINKEHLTKRIREIRLRAREVL